MNLKKIKDAKSRALTTSEIVSLVNSSPNWDRRMYFDIPNEWGATCISAFEEPDGKSYLYGYRPTKVKREGYWNYEVAFDYSKLKANDKHKVEQIVREII